MDIVSLKKFKSRFHRWKSETSWKRALGEGAKGGIRICTWKKRQVLIRVMKGGGRMGKCQPIGPSIQSILLPLPSNHSKMLLREALQSPSHGIYLLGAEWGEPPLSLLHTEKWNWSKKWFLAFSLNIPYKVSSGIELLPLLTERFCNSGFASLPVPLF